MSYTSPAPVATFEAITNNLSSLLRPPFKAKASTLEATHGLENAFAEELRPSFPKATFPVTSNKPPSTPRKNSLTPEVTGLPTARPVDEILPVHRINALTPEATNLAMTALHETDIPPIPAPTHIPTQPHPGTPSSSFPPQQLPQVSSDDIEDDEQEELEMADIMISIADSDLE
ncbi:hypothetical protein F5J12DRAFT_891776 [Pisolithus orientalis]|uniref:uncharacterized protein n=1 Tax=Pisolithus orientalis TaxID=936130 RepID=UPI002224F540|nr:uncharacterized protein F5J12DRAFT_891776 [Pisolithus orientalis]KAI6009646.1 hypothetical protein F5J12DRAFT_891776 [Pisolithus orientalis]